VNVNVNVNEKKAKKVEGEERVERVEGERAHLGFASNSSTHNHLTHSRSMDAGACSPSA
jgi:hypothetical protein